MQAQFSKLFEDARDEGRLVLDERTAKSILAAYGIKVPRGVQLLPGDQHQNMDLTGPFVAKLVSRDLIHKSDIGGVRLGLADSSAAHDAALDLQRIAGKHGLRFDGVLVEEMAPAGVEMVVGGVIDPRFGPVLMLGIGGVFVEVFNDTVFRICPITAADAAQMIEDLRGVALLRGARGKASVNESLLVETLLAVGGKGGLLLELENDVSEIDINPLIVSQSGAYACDARMVLNESNRGEHA